MLNNLTKAKNIKTRSVSPENFTGGKGKGAMSTDGEAASCARDLGIGWKVSPFVTIAPNQTFVLADIHAEGAVKHIWVTDDARNRELILRFYWDGSDVPSVEVPMNDFFASADPQIRYRELNSLPVCIGAVKGYNCFWEMPFKKQCRVTVENRSLKDVKIYYSIDYEEKKIDDDCLYFHAQFRRVNPLPYKEVYTILDNVKGKGHYVGTYIYWGTNNSGWWGEGEVKFYLDGDKEFPTICTTGTEDYFGGSWCFAEDGKYVEYSNNYTGLKVSITDNCYKSQQRFSMYRWHIMDPIYFDEDIRVTIQALGWRSGGRYLPLQEDISSVAFWYQDSICKTFPELPDRDYLEII